jgi:hypothetical protein
VKRVGSFDRQGLVAAGFEGFQTIATLYHDRAPSVSFGPGVYVILREEAGTPRFRVVGTGGHFKGRDPNVPTALLREKWVPGATVVYIGMASSIRDRVWSLVRFGNGQAVAHWGGRYLWQLPRSGQLIVAWAGEATPRLKELELLGQFASEYGSAPFANIAA